MQNISLINTRFGLADKLIFMLDENEMQVAEIKTRLCSARVALQGAQVLAWTPVDEKPVIWLSEDAVFRKGKSIRGGIPVCWPWFGAHTSQPDFPAHGIARTIDWEVVASSELDDGRIQLVFSLVQGDATRSLWPYTCALELHIIFGRTLDIELITRNTDAQPVTITEALHTYFTVGDVKKTKIEGLNTCEYLDKVEDFKRKQQDGDIKFTTEVDRVYVNTVSECVLDDSEWQRRIFISKSGSNSTVVWNPWAERAKEMGDLGESGYLSMVCVETANAADNAVTINSGAEHRLCVSYRVESTV